MNIEVLTDEEKVALRKRFDDLVLAVEQTPEPPRRGTFMTPSGIPILLVRTAGFLDLSKVCEYPRFEVFGRARQLTQNRRFPIIPSVQGGDSCYPLGDIGHHSALFDETLCRSWRESPPYMARLSALLDTTLRLTCIKVRRRVA